MAELRKILAAALAALTLCGCDSFHGGDTVHPAFLKAKKYRESGDYQAAAGQLRRFLQARPESARGHLEMASVCEEHLGDYVSALYHYQEYLRLEPKGESAPAVREWVVKCREKLIGRSPEMLSLQRSADIGRLAAEENARLRTELAVQKKQLTALLREQEALKRELADASKAVAVAAAAPPPETAKPEKRETPENAPSTPAADGKAAETAAATPTAPPEVAGTEKTADFPPLEKPAPIPAWPREYVVRRGDSLSAISREVYGSIRHYRVIMEANHLRSADAIRVGQRLVLPQLPEAGKEEKKP